MSDHYREHRDDMTPEQIRDAAAYVRSLIRYPRDPARPSDHASPRSQGVLDAARARIDRERRTPKETP